MIRVLLAEDMNMVRGALVALLDLEPDIEVVAQLDNGTAIVEEARRTQPDVAVLDIDLPGLDGITAAERLRETLPTCRTMVLTGMDQPGRLLRALQAYVRGFLLKDAHAEDLANAIRKIDAGGRVIDPELVAAAFDVGTSPSPTARWTCFAPPQPVPRPTRSPSASPSPRQRSATTCPTPTPSWVDATATRPSVSHWTPAGSDLRCWV